MHPDDDEIVENEYARLRRSLSAWSPGPSTLAFFAALVLLAAFTRVGLSAPHGAADLVVAQAQWLVWVMVAAVALAHALLVAAAARLRSVPVALGVLLGGAAGLPWLASVARGPLRALLSVVAASLCDASPMSCPPPAWSPLVGLLVGALLAPIVVTAVRVRAEPAWDAPARMLWNTGLWIALLSAVLLVRNLAALGALAVVWAVAGACLLAGLTDSVLRARRLDRLLASGGAVVTALRAGDPPELRPYASASGINAHDAVLRVGDAASGGPYRDGRAGVALALVPTDVSVLREALARRWKRQALALLIAAGVYALSLLPIGPSAPDLH